MVSRDDADSDQHLASGAGQRSRLSAVPSGGVEMELSGILAGIQVSDSRGTFFRLSRSFLLPIAHVVSCSFTRGAARNDMRDFPCAMIVRDYIALVIVLGF